VWLTTEADDQSFLHCVTVWTDVTSDHIGRRDAILTINVHQQQVYVLLDSDNHTIWQVLLINHREVTSYFRKLVRVCLAEILLIAFSHRII